MNQQELPITPAHSLKEELKRALSQVPGLSEVERLIATKFTSDAPVLTEIAQYLFAIGGKRVRPLLALMAGRLFGMRTPSAELIEVASGIELIHMATLLHDDIIDKSPLRRHHTSPFFKYGLDATLLTGDFLLTRAFSLCAHLDRFIIDETEKACVELTEGEVLERSLAEVSHTIESSLTIARKKTAALFRLGCLSGAHLAAAPKESVQALGQFGEQLGVAFQVLDDILDVTASEDLLGKPSGTDLRERKPSLINVLWLESGSKLAQTLKTSPTTNEDTFIAEALQELRAKDSAVVARARSIALGIASQAEQSLDTVVARHESLDAGVVAQLRALVRYTVERSG